MNNFILGIVGIPVVGYIIAATYHLHFTGSCICDTTPIRQLYSKIRRWWIIHCKSTKYLTELAQDENGEIFYVGDGLRRNVATSP